MKKKYQALRMFAMLHRIVGWLASAAALVVVWVGLRRTLASQPFFDGLFYYFLVAVGIELFGLSLRRMANSCTCSSTSRKTSSAHSWTYSWTSSKTRARNQQPLDTLISSVYSRGFQCCLFFFPDWGATLLPRKSLCVVRGDRSHLSDGDAIQ